jgi:hypothetical protein
MFPEILSIWKRESVEVATRKRGLRYGDVEPTEVVPANVEVAVVDVAKIAATVGVDEETTFPPASIAASMLVPAPKSRRALVTKFEVKKFVVVAFVVVLFIAVKFWRVVEPDTKRSPEFDTENRVVVANPETDERRRSGDVPLFAPITSSRARGEDVPIPTFPFPSTTNLSALFVCKTITPAASVALRVIPAVSSFKIVRNLVISRVEGPAPIPPISMNPAVAIFPPSSIVNTSFARESETLKSVPEPASENTAPVVSVVPTPTLPSTSNPFVGAAV